MGTADCLSHGIKFSHLAKVPTVDIGLLLARDRYAGWQIKHNFRFFFYGRDITTSNSAILRVGPIYIKFGMKLGLSLTLPF